MLIITGTFVSFDKQHRISLDSRVFKYFNKCCRINQLSWVKTTNIRSKSRRSFTEDDPQSQCCVLWVCYTDHCYSSAGNDGDTLDYRSPIFPGITLFLCHSKYKKCFLQNFSCFFCSNQTQVWSLSITNVEVTDYPWYLWGFCAPPPPRPYIQQKMGRSTICGGTESKTLVCATVVRYSDFTQPFLWSVLKYKSSLPLPLYKYEFIYAFI